MLKTASLASGSSGNSYFVKNEEGLFIFDLGISVKRLRSSLESFSLNISELEAVFISHEHSDHISGLKTFVKRYPHIPVFISSKTYQKIKIKAPSFVFFEPGQTLYFKNFEIEFLRKPHDAVEPVFFKMKMDDGIVSIITDFGYPNDEIVKSISESRVLYLEANYDLRMLESGSYPRMLKERIKSKEGHLSNCQAANLLKSHYSEKLDYLILSHISEKNNTYDIAKNSIEKILGKKNFSLFVAKQKTPTPLIEI